MAFAALLLGSGCFVDGDERCDDGQVLVKNSGLIPDACTCGPGTVPDEARGHGCVACGANEVAVNGVCGCVEGHARPSEGGPCEPASIGASCESDADCVAPFAHCALDGSARYCTSQGCSATSCPTGYACEQGEGDSYCAELPAGLGAPCMSDADCASGEAKTCDTMTSNTCLMTGCATQQVTCPGYYACCDVSSIVPGFSLCVAPSALTSDGECAFGTRVAP